MLVIIQVITHVRLKVIMLEVLIVHVYQHILVTTLETMQVSLAEQEYLLMKELVLKTIQGIL